MTKKFTSIKASVLALSSLGLISLSGCQVDENYSFENIKNVNTDITLFENGISIPLVEKTARITVDSILRASGLDTTSFASYLKLADDGSYYISYQQDLSFNEVIEELDLKNLVKVSGIDYSQSVSYDIGDLNATDMKISKTEFKKIQSVDDLNIEINIPSQSRESTLLPLNIVQDAASAAEMLGQSTVSLPDYSPSFTAENVSIDAFSLPSFIKSIESATLKSGAGIKVSVSIPDCIFSAGKIIPDLRADLSDVLTFVSGTSTLDLSSLELNASNSYSASKTFAVASLNTEKFTQNKSVAISGKLISTGLQASLAQAKALSSDLKVKVNIEFVDFALDQAYGQIEGLSYEINEGTGNHLYELPSEIGNFGTFSIIPKNNPALTIALDIPEIEGIQISAENGLVIKVPSFLRFSNIPSDFTYDESANTLTLNVIKTANYSLPISELVIVPQKLDSKYVVSGEASVKGTIGLPDGRVDLAKLSQLSGKSLGVTASIPDLEAQSVKLEKLAIDIDESAKLTLMKGSEIPEMVNKIEAINLDGTRLAIDLQLNNLPDIGDGKFLIDLTAEFPDFVVPSQIRLQGEIVDGTFAQSFDIEKLDFSSYDLKKMREEGTDLSGNTRFYGKVSAENPSVNLDGINASISGSVNVKIADANDEIKIKDVTAFIDYQLDTLFKFPFFTLPKELKGCTLDLPKAQLSADISSNLSLPVSAEINLEDGLLKLPLEFPYSNSVDVVESAHNSFEIDLNPLLQIQKDSISAQFDLKLSPEKVSKVDMFADYSLDLALAVEVPVQLGDEFSFTYADTVALGSSADILKEVLAMTSAQLFGQVESTLPFTVGVALELLAYDAENNTYTVLPTEEIKTVLAKAGENNDFTLLLKTLEGSDLSALSHLRFSIDLASNGQVLGKENYICISGLGITVPEGVSVNVSELINSSKEQE